LTRSPGRDQSSEHVNGSGKRRRELVCVDARLGHVRLPTTATTNGECHFPNNEVGTQSAIPGVISGDGE
jgi:hypothetical protein